MRYAYGITTALLLGGTAATFALQEPSLAQMAQNEPGTMTATTAPRPGAPLSFADLAANLQPAVVNISTTQKIQINRGGGNNPFEGTPFEDFFGQQGRGGGNERPITREASSLGSGFIISADGYIVTNNHVISGSGGGSPGGRSPHSSTVSSIKVIMPDRTEYNARIVGRDPASDLAVLKIEGKNLPFVKFGDSTRTRVGDWVIAIGNPFGLGSTLTAGVVSALHRVTGQGGAYDRYIQTDASINQGNSGGPMFDLNGNVIGINTMIFSPTGGNVGIGFAIPAEEALPIVQQLQGGGTVQRGYLGVGIQALDDGAADALGIAKNRGELIARVEPGEGAAKAGIKVGDVVLKVAGREVTPDETLSYLVANQKVGARVPIELLRDGKRQTVTALVGQRPSEDKIAAIGQNEDQGMAPEDEQSTAQAAKASLGLSVIPLTPDIARRLGIQATVRGVVVGSVDPASDAAAKGLQRGDVILSANNRPTLTPADITSAANSAKAAGRQNVLLQFQRGNGPAVYRAVKIAEG